jgi:hypothetical protein
MRLLRNIAKPPKNAEQNRSGRITVPKRPMQRRWCRENARRSCFNALRWPTNNRGAGPKPRHASPNPSPQHSAVNETLFLTSRSLPETKPSYLLAEFNTLKGARNAYSDFRRHFTRSRRCRVSHPDLVLTCCSSERQGSDIFGTICSSARARSDQMRKPAGILSAGGPPMFHSFGAV